MSLIARVLGKVKQAADRGIIITAFSPRQYQYLDFHNIISWFLTLINFPVGFDSTEKEYCTCTFISVHCEKLSDFPHTSIKFLKVFIQQ